MPAFEYVALDQNGRKKKGVLEGDSLKHVRQLLRDSGLTPMGVEITASVQKEAKQFSFLRMFGKLRPMDLVIFTRQLATLINAGLPVEQALSTVAQQTNRRKARSIFMSVRSRVMEGHTLTTSMTEYSATFDDLYRSSVAAGEQSGKLDIVLDNLSNFLEKNYDSRRNVESSLYYPILLFTCAVLIVGGLMTTVVPTIVEVFDQTGQALPPATALLINVSEFLRSWTWLILLTSVVSLIVIRYSLTIPPIRLWWHRIKLGIPVIGWFSRSMNATRYANTLSILGSSGVPLVDGMAIASAVVSNHWIKRQLEGAAEQVSEGTSLNRALEATKQFPPIFVHMVASGEQSGTLDLMLQKSSEYQQKDLERLIATMVELFRPLMLLIMAGIVLLIMVAILLPILNMNQMGLS
ncbi:MAG: type II secretion system inner membrane protein GspF [Gammaproteobacteria bacterium]|nr:type II secretion system inner membrane protein GspF [Gammaproteobacteria bacterium]